MKQQFIAQPPPFNGGRSMSRTARFLQMKGGIVLVNREQDNYSKNVDKLRMELYKLIECEKLSSDAVQSLSRELDELILAYYRQPDICQELKEP